MWGCIYQVRKPIQENITGPDLDQAWRNMRDSALTLHSPWIFWLRFCMCWGIEIVLAMP